MVIRKLLYSDTKLFYGDTKTILWCFLICYFYDVFWFSPTYYFSHVWYFCQMCAQYFFASFVIQKQNLPIQN